MNSSKKHQGILNTVFLYYKIRELILESNRYNLTSKCILIFND